MISLQPVYNTIIHDKSMTRLCMYCNKSACLISWSIVSSLTARVAVIATAGVSDESYALPVHARRASVLRVCVCVSVCMRVYVCVPACMKTPEQPQRGSESVRQMSPSFFGRVL